MTREHQHDHATIPGLLAQRGCGWRNEPDGQCRQHATGARRPGETAPAAERRAVAVAASAFMSLNPPTKVAWSVRIVPRRARTPTYLLTPIRARGVPIYDSWDFGASTPWVPGTVGGTSLACPLWAGMIAVADQGRAIAGLGSLDGETSDPARTLSGLQGHPDGFPRHHQREQH